jgi:hypothetical protein
MMLSSAYCTWNKRPILEKEGILVGADLSQEWLLPWWWEKYRKFSRLPVAFVDFGLSKEMRDWCRERGHYISLPVADVFMTERENVDPNLAQEWDAEYGVQFWTGRNACFKKPMACLLSPFQRTMWIDLDCEIKSPFQDALILCEHPSSIALAKKCKNAERVEFNSGVIVFKRGCSLIEQWAKLSFEENHLHATDEQALIHIVNQGRIDVNQLPLIYNWSRCDELNPRAAILHWHGRHGKEVISRQIMQANLEQLTSW